MQEAIITISTKGQLVIPAAMRAALGIGAGTRIALFLDGGRLILQPVSEQLVDDTKGMLSGGVSLADELQAERRADRW